MTDDTLPIEVSEAPSVPALIPSEAEASVVFKLAQNLARTTFVPANYQGKPDEIAACMLFSRAVGIDPMIGLQEIVVVKGRPTPSAKLMAARIFEAGHRIEVIAWDDKECKLRGVRKGSEAGVDVTFTMDDATRAGLTSNPSWKNYPKAMLMARATSMLARAAFPDCVLGMAYTAEEIDPEAKPHPSDLDDE